DKGEVDVHAVAPEDVGDLAEQTWLVRRADLHKGVGGGTVVVYIDARRTKAQAFLGEAVSADLLSDERGPLGSFTGLHHLGQLIAYALHHFANGCGDFRRNLDLEGIHGLSGHGCIYLCGKDVDAAGGEGSADVTEKTGGVVA